MRPRQFLTGGYHRRPSNDISAPRAKRIDSKRVTSSSRSQETSLEDDMSLDLSQVSDFEDTNSKYGIKNKPVPVATSTPKPRPGPKPRSASLQSHLSHMQRIDTKRTQMSLDGAKSKDSFSCSRDSLYKTTSSSASPYRIDTKRTQMSLDGAKSKDSFSCSRDSLYKTTSSSASPYRIDTKRTQMSLDGAKSKDSFSCSRDSLYKTTSSSASPYRIDTKRTQMSLDGAKSKDSFSCSRDSLYKTTSSSASPYRYGTELDYSSVSPEYSGQSSADLSPRATTDMVVSPRSHNISSCCVSSWQEGSECDPTRLEARPDGEWNDFWINYNNSLSKVPMKSYYDQCPTPYRTEHLDLNDFDFSIDSSRKRSPDNIKNINNIIRNEGLQLTPRETQNIIKCAHILGNVLSKAIERRSRENDSTKIEEINNSTGNTGRQEKESEIDLKKKNLTLNLKETVLPVEVKEEKRQETVTTQTDISLPNTKSAPIIFERILKQLSKSSIDEADEDDDVFDVKEKK